MAERKHAKGEEKSHAAFLREITAVEDDWNNTRLKLRRVPGEWCRFEATAPCRPHKTRITAVFDAGVARWYHSLGHG